MKTLPLFAAALLAFSAPALADDAKPLIAVVNIQNIMKDSAVSKSVREQLEKKQESFQADFSKKEEQLKKEDQELGKQRNVLAKEAFEEKASAFRKKVTETQKDAEYKKMILNNAANTSYAEIQKNISDIVAGLAKEKGFQVALRMEAPPAWQVLYADPKLDITDEVLSRLNKQLPKISVKFDAPAKK